MLRKGNTLRITYKREENEDSIGFYLDNEAIGGIFGNNIASEIAEHISVLQKHYAWDKVELERALIDYCEQNGIIFAENTFNHKTLFIMTDSDSDCIHFYLDNKEIDRVSNRGSNDILKDMIEDVLEDLKKRICF